MRFRNSHQNAIQMRPVSHCVLCASQLNKQHFMIILLIFERLHKSCLLRLFGRSTFVLSLLTAKLIILFIFAETIIFFLI